MVTEPALSLGRVVFPLPGVQLIDTALSPRPVSDLTERTNPLGGRRWCGQHWRKGPGTAVLGKAGSQGWVAPGTQVAGGLPPPWLRRAAGWTPAVCVNKVRYPHTCFPSGQGQGCLEFGSMLARRGLNDQNRVKPWSPGVGRALGRYFTRVCTTRCQS